MNGESEATMASMVMLSSPFVSKQEHTKDLREEKRKQMDGEYRHAREASPSRDKTEE